ncbi:unnamed protein product [Owenia fusiformis]|uniref:Uncharacterized protein n=1 Tax=Owenia fusiformis TaxID=6347 RepID=A0A8J1UHT3_OWEFU|nr:unnamed protein product [Owenia fusiformis]
MFIYSVAVLLIVAVANGQDCHPDNGCCWLGGWCGSGATDDCVNGRWDYNVGCVPYHQDCCLPNTPPTDPPSPDPTSNTTAPLETDPPLPDCDIRNECCLVGGTCGDAAFDECPGGTWEYGLRCVPFTKTCCIGQITLPPPGPTTTRDPSITYPPLNLTDCGERPAMPALNPKIQIVGGETVVPHSWPWAVELRFDYFNWNDWRHHCTGTLIHPQYAITAGHCIAKSNADGIHQFRVVLGSHDQNNPDGLEVISELEQAFVHEDYSTSIPGSPNDIALLKLDEPVELSNRIGIACLPGYKDQVFSPTDNCWIAGWGETLGTSQQNVLTEAKLNITTNEECDYKWETGSGRVNLIKPEHICIGNGFPGACNGDSGGPLVCEKEGKWIVAGATSFGAAGCQSWNAPNVYTRVSYYIDWIREKMNQT